MKRNAVVYSLIFFVDVLQATAAAKDAAAQATKLRKSSARSAALPPCFLRGDPAFLTPEMTAARNESCSAVFGHLPYGLHAAAPAGNAVQIVGKFASAPPPDIEEWSSCLV